MKMNRLGLFAASLTLLSASSALAAREAGSLLPRSERGALSEVTDQSTVDPSRPAVGTSPGGQKVGPSSCCCEAGSTTQMVPQS